MPICLSWQAWPLAIKFLIDVWSTEVSPWKKKSIFLWLFFFLITFTSPCYHLWNITRLHFISPVSVVVHTHDLVTVYFSCHSSLFLDNFLSRDIWLPSLVLAWWLTAISIQSASPFSNSKVLFQPVFSGPLANYFLTSLFCFQGLHLFLALFSDSSIFHHVYSSGFFSQR